MDNFSCFLNTWLPIIKDFILICAAIIAGYVGISGLSTWKKQFIGKIEYELAKEILKNLYDIKNKIARVRHPFMEFPQEPDLPKEKLENLSKKQKEWHSLIQAYNKRLDLLYNSRGELDKYIIEAKIIWDEEIIIKIQELDEKIHELSYCIKDFVETKNPDAQNNFYDHKSCRPILYSMGNEDKFHADVVQVIQYFEKRFHPIIKNFH